MSESTRNTVAFLFVQHRRLMACLLLLWIGVAITVDKVQGQYPATMPTHAGASTPDVRLDSGLITIGVFWGGIVITAGVVWKIASERQAMLDRMERMEHALRNVKQSVQSIRADELERKENRDDR